jgi:LmbE family N-acetylglucosaminyl deacetylase
MMRRALADRLDRRHLERAVALTVDELQRPAVVLAPHPDDETLGCGGLIALKRDRGVAVTVVFMTDGARSHAHLADATDLVARRRAEASAACAVLGVDPAMVHHLEIGDGELNDSVELAIERLGPLLRDSNGHQLIVPHPGESPLDHRATFHVADETLRRSGRTMDGLLYPVWLWDQFPFTNPFSAPRERHSVRSVVRISARDRLGWRIPKLLDRRVDVSSVIDRKRRALQEHASQMARQDGAADWLTLADIAGGEWLERLLRPSEFYADRTVGVGYRSRGGTVHGATDS